MSRVTARVMTTSEALTQWADGCIAIGTDVWRPWSPSVQPRHGRPVRVEGAPWR
jgi:hypothetical protein